MKRIVLNHVTEIQHHIEYIAHSAEQAKMRIKEISDFSDSLDLLSRIKFEKLGYDPLDSSRALNFIEQLNQTFTYLASLKAAEFIFEEHPNILSLTLNLGTTPGSDIETSDCGGIAAEVFAATHPTSNNKLKKDIEKVSKTTAKYKYAFFMCPNIKGGEYVTKSTSDVIVWSLGDFNY